MRLDIDQVMPRVVVETPAQVINVVVELARVAVESFAQEVNVHAAPENHIEIVTGGPVGPPGKPGEAEGATFTAPAGSTVFGHRAVRLVDGAVFHPDTRDSAHAPAVCGIAQQSSAPGSPVLVRTAGTMTEPSWAWAPGYVWCGADGVLTQTPEPTGWLLAVGRAINPTTLVVDIDTPVMR
jgi:hypothetical protein